MTITTRLASLLAVLVLLAAACGDGDDATTTGAEEPAATTTTTAIETTTTTVAPETTTTTAPDTTTTTSAETTTSAAASGDASETVAAKTDAAIAALPDTWSTTVSNELSNEVGADDIFGACTDEADFDINDIDQFSLAVSTLEAEEPAAEGGLFPGGSASLEARVFESEEVAEDAFVVLEEVIGSEDGRNCLADQFLSFMTEDLPEGAEFDFSIEELSIPDAQVAARISMSMSVEGFAFDFEVDLAGSRDGDCTVYATFFAFDKPFDEELRNSVFTAAVGAA